MQLHINRKTHFIENFPKYELVYDDTVRQKMQEMKLMQEIFRYSDF